MSNKYSFVGDTTYSLLLYQYVNVEGKDYVEALELIGHESQDLRRVKKFYSKLCDVLSKYDFKPRENMKHNRSTL